SAKRVSSNSDGRYQIPDLPPGEYSLRAERGGYLTLAYGQRRPGEPGKPVRLTEGQRLDAIDFPLPRVGVISGRVVDETGEPIAHVNMWAMQFRFYQGARRLVPVAGFGGHTSTDDNGHYRLAGLPPGDFLVMGQSRETWPLEQDTTKVFGYPPSFYPGVVVPAEAQRVKVAVGQDVRNIDFALVPERTSRVAGVVVNAAGLPLAGEAVTLSQEIAGPEMTSVFPSSNTARTGHDGRFSIDNVQAGEYTLSVRIAGSTGEPAQEARQPLQVMGSDIDGLVIVTGSGGQLRGRVISDDGGPVPGMDRLSVRARALTSAARTSTLEFPGNGRVTPDGTFELKGLIGPVVLTTAGLTAEWTLKAVELDGRDLADDPIDVPHGTTLSGVRIVLTNRPTHVHGTLLDETQQSADGTVVVFSEDASRWREGSRVIRAARPDQRGEFSIKGLPAGKYLIAAVDYVQEGQWYDPQFLADLRPRAGRLSLAEMESKRVDLTIKK
ncbi:MAG TPA: carboxypeptidase-like regulatory domain-containing protein, partial [Vicinamibacterales bacterium]|nr:carboxypeptidase-like regulatory domain-containing protein [Vicinamibacterales bacterium]